MKAIVTITGPREAGPGERELMLARAHDVLDQAGVGTVTRVDVPARGASSAGDGGTGGLRPEVQPAVPALQSGSLFGDRVGLLVVDAQWLHKAEAEVLTEIVTAADPEAAVAVFVAAGSIPSPLGKSLKELGETISMKRLNEKSAAQWVAEASRERGVRVGPDAVGALIHHFGTDVGSLARALDQLAASGEAVTAEAVHIRFRTRPDEPSWHYLDALAAGDQGEALRRLADFLEHGHPLVILAAIQSDLRRRSLAAAAPDYDTFVAWDGGRRNYALEKVWRARGRVQPGALSRAIGAVARADLQLKTAPEPTHRVMMERLTVALCRWYQGRA